MPTKRPRREDRTKMESSVVQFEARRSIWKIINKAPISAERFYTTSYYMVVDDSISMNGAVKGPSADDIGHCHLIFTSSLSGFSPGAG